MLVPLPARSADSPYSQTEGDISVFQIINYKAAILPIEQYAYIVLTRGRGRHCYVVQLPLNTTSKSSKLFVLHSTSIFR